MYAFKLLALSVNNITRKKTSMKFNIKKVATAFLSVAMLTTGSAQLSVFAQQTLKYEAENGTLGGSAYIQTDSSASGSRSVSFSDSSCTWSQTVTVSESGYYRIKLYSRGEGSNKINNLSVNGSNAGTFSSANGSAYKASTVNGIYLKRGAEHCQNNNVVGIFYSRLHNH